MSVVNVRIKGLYRIQYVQRHNKLKCRVSTFAGVVSLAGSGSGIGIGRDRATRGKTTTRISIVFVPHVLDRRSNAPAKRSQRGLEKSDGGLRSNEIKRQGVTVK